MASSTRSRFVFNTDEEISEKRLKATPENTRKCNDKAAKVFRAYLEEKGEDKLVS